MDTRGALRPWELRLLKFFVIIIIIIIIIIENSPHQQGTEPEPSDPGAQFAWSELN